MKARLDLDVLHEAWTTMGMPAAQVKANLGVLKSRLDEVDVIAGKLGGGA